MGTVYPGIVVDADGQLRMPSTVGLAGQALRRSSTPGLLEWGPTRIEVRPGQNPQPIIDAAPAGSTVVFLEGEHALDVAPITRACVYIGKSLNIVLQGARLRVKNAQATYSTVTPAVTPAGSAGVEVWPWYIAVPVLNDLQARPVSSVTSLTTKRIKISGTGTPDRFQVGTTADVTVPITTPASGSEINITGGWQNIGDGIEIRFNATTGHTLNDEWFLGTTGQPVYVFRVGTGFQASPITDVVFSGSGTLDGNYANQVFTNILAVDISAGILIDGRVEDVVIKDLEIINTERPVMAYGRNSGSFSAGGATAGGQSFNCNRLVIDNIYAHDCKGAVLIGHPAKRGRQNDIRITDCRIASTRGPAIEPNFRTQGFLISGNVLTCPAGVSPIHLWRGGSQGLIASNIGVDITTGALVDSSTPSGWPAASGVTQANNALVTTLQVSPGDSNPYWTVLSAGSVLPFAHFSLDGSPGDSRGNMTGTLTAGSYGAALPTGSLGSFAAATVDDRVTCSGLASSPTFLEVWLWAFLDFDANAAAKTIFSHRDSANALIQLTSNTATDLRVQWRNTGGGTVNTLIATVASLNRVRKFLCFRWTNNDQKLWIDNVLVASSAAAVTGSYASAVTQIGNAALNTVGAVGRIDEVSIFTSAPSDADRLAAYNQGIS